MGKFWGNFRGNFQYYVIIHFVVSGTVVQYVHVHVVVQGVPDTHPVVNVM